MSHICKFESFSKVAPSSHVPSQSPGLACQSCSLSYFTGDGIRRKLWTAHLTRHIFSCFTAHILMSHWHWLKNKVCCALHSIPSSWAHVVCCLILYDSPFYSLLSTFSLIFLFILLFFTFIFHVGDKNPAHSFGILAENDLLTGYEPNDLHIAETTDIFIQESSGDNRSLNLHQSEISEPVFFPLHPDPGGMLSRSLGMPSRKNGPPSIWDTHGISENVFANPTASSSALYPQESNPWCSDVSEHTSHMWWVKAKHQFRIRDASQDRQPEIQSSSVREDLQRIMEQTNNDCRFQILILTNSPRQLCLLAGR